MNGAAAQGAFKERLKRCDRAVLVAALESLAIRHPEVPRVVENMAEFWDRLRRPRKPGESLNPPTPAR